MISELATARPQLPWFRWAFFVGLLLTVIANVIRARQPARAKVLSWIAIAVFLACFAGWFGYL